METRSEQEGQRDEIQEILLSRLLLNKLQYKRPISLKARRKTRDEIKDDHQHK